MRKFKQVDAFTDRPFRGNPVAVVLDGQGLDAAEMQHIARWTNLSETTFLLPSTLASYCVRIFSPTHELPFAGHPTIGSAHAALEAGIAKGNKLKQECGAGVLDLSVEDGVIFVRAPAVKVSSAPNIPGDVGIALAAGAPLLRADVGPVWLTGEVNDAATLAALKPDMGALAKWSREGLRVPRPLVRACPRHPGRSGLRQRQHLRRRLSAAPQARAKGLRRKAGTADGPRRPCPHARSRGFDRPRRPRRHLRRRVA